MHSTFHGLEIGKRAILANQTALSTTGHNIANANTQGYTRQEAVLQSSRPLTYQNNIQIGTGVEVAQFRRIRDDYLDMQYRNEQQKASYWEAKSFALANLETVFNETTDSGLNIELNRLWQSFQELGKQPDNLSLRTAVLANGKNIADHLNELSKSIDFQAEILEKQIDGTATELNTIIKQVAELNNQISKIVEAGNQPNDLLDKRDLLLDNLAKLANIQTSSAQNGMVDISIDTHKLLTGTTASELTIDSKTGTAKIAGTTVQIGGGQLKGLLETHGYTAADGTTAGTIPTLKANLNTLATAIANTLNAIHTSDGARNLDTTAPLEKHLFFVNKDNPTIAPTSAADMIINPILTNAPHKIAAAKSDKPGDGTNAIAMADALSGKIKIAEPETTINDFYQMVLSKIGTEVQIAQRWSDNTSATTQQIDTQRQSISGVSIDEELTNMVRYQQAYNAAARYVAAVNEMLDKLINGMR